jgi:hypothetical protein
MSEKVQATRDAIANASELSLAKLGLLALIDEATGYQDVRSDDALAKKLAELEAKEAPK